MDDLLRRLRYQGQSWDAIAEAVAVSRNAAMDRGRQLKARLARRLRPQPAEDPDRPPMPAGHKVSWAVLVGGTVLTDEPYPRPMPLGRDRRGVVGETC
jgi:hypothetical protein